MLAPYVTMVTPENTWTSKLEEKLSDLEIKVLPYSPHLSGFLLSKYQMFQDLYNHLGLEKLKNKRAIENAFDEFI